MPTYVYLVPAIAFFSISNTSGILATVMFALPPIVRMTVLEIEPGKGIIQLAQDAINAYGLNEAAAYERCKRHPSRP